ncbi:Carbon monoxide oxidation accessory protein CoxG [Caenispirillum salinarum AK4]|uniref:Carbon monoxide oxidation accessory protein CoxG n=1 Tax=Caenispirillum salinarum AK4 TaxID=1238182 RepID=K9HN59_9PROT|nr:carbon monoxide dehydrogenase subunit G [Caenispirillum salinarum]EKV31753.1 Carbon monoxide oxidation accessory protein CoxG [Caenispirillum salinarum AK4]
MDITGEYLIPTDRKTVWDAINDPEMLKACIPGCQELTETDEGPAGGYEAKVQAKVGPVKATFNGHVRLEDVNEPESYRIVGEGKGGAAGFAKGGADVWLEEVDATNTKLTYKADAQVGGKLAQLGSRLIQGTAKKYADDFFANLTARIAPQEAEPAETTGMGVATGDAGRPEEPAPAGVGAPSPAVGTVAGRSPDRAGGEAAASTPEQPMAAHAAAATTAAKSGQTKGEAAGTPMKTWMWWIGGAVLIILIILLLGGGGG